VETRAGLSYGSKHIVAVGDTYNPMIGLAKAITELTSKENE